MTDESVIHAFYRTMALRLTLSKPVLRAYQKRIHPDRFFTKLLMFAASFMTRKAANLNVDEKKQFLLWTDAAGEKIIAKRARACA